MHTIGRWSVENAFEPHLNVEVTDFCSTAHSLQNGEKNKTVLKFALNEFLLELGFRHVF